jgi:hypothetical protein
MQIIIGEGFIFQTLALSQDKKIGSLIISMADKQYKQGEYIESFKPSDENLLCDLVFTNPLAIDLFIENLNKLKSHME